MTRIRMVHDSEAPPFVDPAFAADCHAALDVVLQKGIVSVTFIGESGDRQTLYLESHPDSCSLQIGTLTRAAMAYLKPMNEDDDE